VDLIYLARPVAPLPGSTETVLSNLTDAEWWLVHLQRANPGFAIIAPWIQEIHLGISNDSDPDSRDAGIARCRATAARCDGIILCGPRISSGMLAELAAMREQPSPWTVHRFSRRDQRFDLDIARGQSSDRSPSWLRCTWFGAVPQSYDLTAVEIIAAERAAARRES
jgi:hypothetical protein